MHKPVWLRFLANRKAKSKMIRTRSSMLSVRSAAIVGAAVGQIGDRWLKMIAQNRNQFLRDSKYNSMLKKKDKRISVYPRTGLWILSWLKVLLVGLLLLLLLLLL